jgi:flagellar M-ring protein FliF
VQQESFDPDGQVVRSESTTEEKASETQPADNGQVSASNNIPGGVPPADGQMGSNSGKTESTTNYEITKTVRTEVTEPGEMKRLSVAVAVDGVTAPGKDGKPGPYTARSAEEMQRIEQLVRTAVGFNSDRGDQVTVVNVRFPSSEDAEGVTAANPLMGFDKNDIMRAVELAIMVVVAVLIIFFVVRPLLKAGPAGAGMPMMMAPGGVAGRPATGPDGQPLHVVVDPATGQPLQITAQSNEIEQKIDIARIEGQVKASSVKRVSEFVEKHPEESVSILRSWLHDTA